MVLFLDRWVESHVDIYVQLPNNLRMEVGLGELTQQWSSEYSMLLALWFLNLGMLVYIAEFCDHADSVPVSTILGLFISDVGWRVDPPSKRSR